MTADETYMFGAEAAEIRRLAVQHRLWADAVSAHWRRAGFQEGQTLLDLGAGPGFATLDLAELVGPDGRVIAVEPESRYADALRRELDLGSARPRGRVDLREVAAADLELAPASLDGAYVRWVFNFVPGADAVVAKLADALRPGARLAVFDYLQWPALTWGPNNESLPAIRAAVLAAYEDFGADPNAGHRVPAAMAAAGLEVEEIRPVVRVVRPHEPMWGWPEVWMQDFFPKVVAMGHLQPADFERWQQEWAANKAHPAGFFVTPTLVELTGRRPR